MTGLLQLPMFQRGASGEKPDTRDENSYEMTKPTPDKNTVDPDVLELLKGGDVEAFANAKRGSSLRDFLANPNGKAEPGTLRNFLSRILPSATPPSSVQRQPARQIPSQPQTQQPRDYTAPKLLPPQLIPDARANLLRQNGLNPNSYIPPQPSTIPGAAILRKGMTTGDPRGKMYDQSDEMDTISDKFRPPKTSSDAGNVQVADGSNVQQLHPPGTFLDNTQKGDIVNGLAKKLGVEPPDNVIKIPYPLTKES